MNIAALLAGLFSGIIGAMGLGGGAVLIIYLKLFTQKEQLTAQGINLLFFIPIAAAAVIVYGIRKQIKWRMVLKVAFWGLIGAAMGIFTANFLGNQITGKIFGGILVCMGIREILSKNIEKKEK